MYAYGVEIFHAANGDYISGAVAHGFKLYLFPAVNILFNEYLRYGGRVKSRLRSRCHLFAVICHSAACTAEGEGGAYYYGVAYFFGGFERVREVFRRFGRNGGFVYRSHCFLKKLSVLGFFNSFCVGADKAHSVFCQKAAFGKLGREGQSRLSAESGKKAVGLFFFDYSFERSYRQRFEIYLVRHGAVRHNCRRV